jgi:3-deoxy-D-manno-octulosonic-acid transferase
LRAKGIYLLYRVLQTLAWPAVLFYFALRSARNAQYRQSILERAGFLPAHFVQTVPGCIWLHAVSVGEIIASLELIRALRREFPLVPVYVSAGTTAGYAMATEKLASLATGVFYAPVDYVSAVRRVLRTVRPSVLVVLETEIWPNLFREARRSGAAVLMVNGRISDRTARRYARFHWFFGAVLTQANRILAQSEVDRGRFLAAGAPSTIVEDGGNLKYDFEPREAPADSPVREFLARHTGKRLWIAASTTADDRIAEEDAVLDAFATLQDWVLILAPRKPDRFADVSEKIAARKVPFVRRTGLDGPAKDYPAILLLNTIGELAGLFALADVVFMGGSLADRGGHNILEPAFFGKPVITGPHLENFREIAADFREHRAVITIERAEDLAAAVLGAADDPEVGRRARSRAAARRGATSHAVHVIGELHAGALPVARPTFLERLVLTPFTWIWRRGGEMRATKALNEYRRIDAPVISVGNITIGGTGKTPFVAWLARRLRDEGHHPGILTRGYGRRSHENILAVPAGGQAPVSQTGDEAQIFLRAGAADLGVAADRYTVGLILRSRFGSDVLLLDDGFQHRRLQRDLDIVLVDSLSPFGNGELMPLGRLREPMEALARADLFVITRTELSVITPAIERKLCEHNPRAPIFRASTIADRWVDAVTGEELTSRDLPVERAVAFCGIGNPAAFWRLLSSQGFSPAECVEYSDHHSYTPAELRRLVQLAKSHNATVLLTTEKDAVNLCEGAQSLLGEVKLLWLRIDLRVENDHALLGLIATRLKASSRPQGLDR